MQVKDQFASIIEDKIAESNKQTTDLLLNLNNQMQVLSKGEGVDHSYSTKTLNPSSSGTPASASQPLYGMPPNYFAGQTPPPPPVQPSTAEPVRPVQQTNVMVANPATPAPLASVPRSASLSRTNELMNFEPPYTTVAYSVPPIPLQGWGVPRGPVPDDVCNDLLKRAPVSSIETMAQTDPIAHRLTSNAQTSTSGNYEANLARMKEDLANMFKTKLGLDMGRSHLYQKPYSDDFDFVSYPVGWRVPDFIKFSGDDKRTTWEHISQYLAQLGEASSSNALCVHLFSLSLTGTAFSWFSSLPPNLVHSWNELEQKFHDHFYSGDNEAKLTDLTSVRQGRDESIMDYFKRFKNVKNRCFNLSIFERDLADLVLGGLRSHFKEKLEGCDYFSINQLQIRALNQEYKFAKETYMTHQSSTHIVDCKSDNSNGEGKRVYVAEFVWPSEAESYSCSSLKPTQRIGKKKLVLLLMFLSVIAYLMNCLKTDTSSCLMPYHRLKN
jgi:hypothetical protein